RRSAHMKTQRRRLRSAAIGLAAAAAVAFGTLPALSSSADVPAGAPAFASTSNSSDPFIYRCKNGKYCMVTSKDIGVINDPSGNPCPNPYPMKTTLMYTSSDGLKWSAGAQILQESQLVGSGAVANANHLWAPAV